MDLIESIKKSEVSRGVALNNQLIYLFNMIEENNDSEERFKKVTDYLEGLFLANKMFEETKAQGLSAFQKIKKVVEEKSDDIEDKDDFYDFLIKNVTKIAKNWGNQTRLERAFKNEDINPQYIDEIFNIKKYFEYQMPGILTFLVDENGNTINPRDENVKIDKDKTYQKVEALYEYITGNLENGDSRFDKLTLDSQGKFGTVAGLLQNEEEVYAGVEDYNLEPLIRGYEFAKAHNMDIRINTLVFFRDFPGRLVGESKERYKIALENYGKAVASVVKKYEKEGVNTSIDMFNELVDYYEPFLERTNNWMSKLSVEDLCQIALDLKREMPNASFGYNDWNFENPEKRKSIFKVLEKIQKFEKENNCQIIDHIGTQCHTSINDIRGLIESLKELKQFGLPIDVTELDISKSLDGIDYKKATPEELKAIKKYEQKLQNDVMKILRNYAEKGIIRSITAWSITDEICADFCEGKEASIIEMNYDNKNGFTFSGKDMDKEIIITESEKKLIEEHKKRVAKTSEINENPVQDFCFHTHTSRCGHGAEITSDEDWVINAINAGIKKLAFTDHIPLPDGMNHIPNSRMDIAEVDSYLKSIEYLQNKYREKIEIESGFEFEYSDRDVEHLRNLKNRTDKMILGQHFVIDDNGREYAIERGNDGKQISDEVLDLYAKSIISAIDKGLPNVIAHPDLFMQARDNFGKKEEEITRAICRKAVEKRIPLEINLGKIASKVESNLTVEELKERIPYPSAEFWKIVAEETEIAKEKGKDLFVIYGKDAHFPGQLSTEKDYELAKAIIGDQHLEQLNIVTEYKKLEKLTAHKTIQELVQESIEDISGLAMLDEIGSELEQTTQQNKLKFK